MEKQEARPQLGLALKQLRKERGLSQRGLADLAGSAQTHISQIELGLKSPTADWLYRVAEALGIKASTLVCRAEHLAQANHAHLPEAA